MLNKTTGVLTLACALLAACSTAPDKAAAPQSGQAAARQTSSSKPAEPADKASAPTASKSSNASSSAASSLKPYAEIIKGFSRQPGYLTVYKKDERYLLELKDSDFAQPFFFSTQRSRGIGERWLWSGMMLESGIGAFVRLSDRVQWIERNPRFVAPTNKAMQFAVRDSFSGSLRGAAPILSQPHPETRAILIDLNALVLSDFTASAAQLQNTYRQPYQFDRTNSLIQQIYNTPSETLIELQKHYGAATLAQPAPGQPVQPSFPGTLPDGRSMFLGFTLSLSPLPDEMAARPADQRVGFFRTERHNFDRELQLDPREQLIHRWRLEKKDPAAEISEPVRPITYWLDRNIPERYRDTVRKAILSWNAAFEKAGFKDAIRVEQQSDDAAWRSGSRQHATVQWLLGTDASTSIGPSQVDPRSGEILDADIVISDFNPRYARRDASFNLPGQPSHNPHAHCNFAEASFADLWQTIALAAARGEIDPEGPEAEELAKEVLAWVVMHEVGHTLGLTHNFRASAAYSLEQLRDPAFVSKFGLATSVMDYTPLNQQSKAFGTRQTLVQTQLGPYDLWAIEYGYTPLPREDERTLLRKIASRADTDPYLAYADDYDAGSFDGNILSAGIDPAVARFDLGNDPIAWFQLRLQLSRELWDALAKRPPSGREDEASLTRSAVLRSLSQLGSAASNAARNMGGVSVSRHSTPGQRDIFTAIPAATQRATLAALSNGLFQPSSFQIDPSLLRRLAASPFDRRELEPQPAIISSVLRLQANVLDLLFSDRLSNRLLEGELNTPARERFTLSELYSTLRKDIWLELKANADIPLQRRNLQRAHLSRLSAQILKPSAATPADARALARLEASTLQTELRRALQQGNRSVEAQAHLQESLATLNETLSAPLVRNAP